MEHIESRTVIVGSGKLLDGAITLETLEELEAGLGVAPLDLDALRGIVRAYRARLAFEAEAQRGILCVSCGTLHLHTITCQVMAERSRLAQTALSDGRQPSRSGRTPRVRAFGVAPDGKHPGGLAPPYPPEQD